MKIKDYIEEKEVNKKIQKAKGISGLIKKAVPLVITATMVAALVGCEFKQPEPTPTPGPGQIVAPVGPDVSVTPDPPVTPIEPDVPVTPEPQKPAEVPIEQINAFVDSMRGNNFTYRLTSPEFSREVMLDEKVMQLREENLNEIYDISGDKPYIYSLNADGIWTKNIALGHEKAASVYNEMTNLAEQISQATWESYDPATNEVEGQLEGKDIRLLISDTEVVVEIDGVNFTLSQVGEVATELPAKVVDQTSENIYEIVDGKYVFNYNAVHSVLDPWIKGENQWDQDLVDYADQSAGEKTIGILCLSCSEDMFSFKVLSTLDGEYRLRDAGIPETSALYGGIKDGTIKTKADFVKLLNNQINIKDVLNVSKPIDTLQMDDCTVEQMETMNKNILKELELKGVRGEGLLNDKPETKIENYSKAEVLFSFKGKLSPKSIGSDLGWRHDFDMYYIIKFNNKIEYVNVGIYVSPPSPINKADSTMDVIVRDNRNRWFCRYVERTELDMANERVVRQNFPEVIYTGEKSVTNEKSSETKTNSIQNQTMYIKEKEREL